MDAFVKIPQVREWCGLALYTNLFGEYFAIGAKALKLHRIHS